MNTIFSNASEALLLDGGTQSENPTDGIKEVAPAGRSDQVIPLLILGGNKEAQPPVSPLPGGHLACGGVPLLGWHGLHTTPCPKKKSSCEAALLDFGICSRRRILKKICTRLKRGINPEEWNSYTRIRGDSRMAEGCMAIRFTGTNLEILKKPANLHTEPAQFNLAVGIHFRKTIFCPAQFLGLGEYLLWDDRCFTAMDAEKFHRTYRHSS